jgi:hypothetical protein
MTHRLLSLGARRSLRDELYALTDRERFGADAPVKLM